MPQEFSAGAVIFRREHGKTLYLILQYEKQHWDFVKGHIEYGEDEGEAVVRETCEETGISELGFIPGFREKIEYFFKKEGKTVHKQVMFLLAETKTKEVTLSFEHIGFEWLAYEKALGRLTFENAKDILKKADSFLEALHR